MAPMMQRRFANLDDEDDDGPYDPRYPGQRVVADGGRVRVPVMLTDGMPDWMPPRRRPALYDASAHRPHFAVVDASDPHVRAAERAYEDRSRWLQDAWKTPSVSQRDAAPPPDDDEELSPRDRYIARLQTAYRTPFGQAAASRAIAGPSGADAIEAQRRRWTREDGGGGVAPRGVTMGQHAPANFPTQDAALADRDVAYGEYLDYLQNAWKRPCGVIAGGRR